MRSCQELADDPLAYTKRDPHNVDFRPFGKAGHLGRKRGPVVAKSPLWRAERRPPWSQKDRGTIGLRFSARHPLMPRADKAASSFRLLASPRRKPGSSFFALRALDSGLRRNDESGEQTARKREVR